MMTMLPSLRCSIPWASCLIGLAATAQTQLLPDLAAARGGGLLSNCDTSLHVGINTTIQNNYYCYFAPEVQVGNTSVESLTWSYYMNGAFGQQTSPTLQLNYPGQVEYPVCLTVDAYDLIAQQPCSTTVCDLITPLPDVSCISLQAAFGIASVNGNTITFQNNSTFGETIQQVLWSFGDGATIAATTPTHDFIGSGPFEVCLTVIGPAPAFCTSTLCQYLYLGPGNVDCPLLIDQGFIMLQSENLVGVLDTSNTSGMNSRIDWDFGDGALAEGNVALHAYGSPGEFQLCGTLRAWGPLLVDTCVTSICRPVIAFPVLVTEELVAVRTMSVRPNPFSSSISIVGQLVGAFSLSVLDASGRIVHGQAARAGSSLNLDLSHLEAGAYVLRIADEHGALTSHIIKE
ncbi:MAG: T9SS type A sorting domain-containing protein [Flavobacteriales bacterium]|nr:T9SS type A sorting domain-containing protein [Flavobacteriales bacterium]MBP7407290.1 T9SS type A sorting domain-containing protein [Flavobacteriales bacterium]